MTCLDSRQGLMNGISLLPTSVIANIGIVLAMSVTGIWGGRV